MYAMQTPTPTRSCLRSCNRHALGFISIGARGPILSNKTLLYRLGWLNESARKAPLYLVSRSGKRDSRLVLSWWPIRYLGKALTSLDQVTATLPTAPSNTALWIQEKICLTARHRSSGWMPTRRDV